MFCKTVKKAPRGQTAHWMIFNTGTEYEFAECSYCQYEMDRSKYDEYEMPQKCAGCGAYMKDIDFAE